MPHKPLLLPRPQRLTQVGASRSRADLASASVVIDPVAVPRTEGYRLRISADAVEAVAHDAAGAFYAKQTLGQLQRDREITGQSSCMDIEDWPSFPNRGVMLDISRDKVPTMATLYGLVDLFASLKINQLQLYTEHTFAYAGHETVWRNASPMTAEEIRSLDAYCRERFIELVPNQNTFGHMERWLKHDGYRDLAEAPDGADMPWGGRFPGGFSLNPTDPQSLALVEDLLDQLRPHFTSQQINVGCDETFDLGQGKSATLVKERGEGCVYVRFLRQVLDAALRRGFTPQFWGDIIVKHPQLLGELPADRGVVALSWGYDVGFDFDAQLAKFAAAGLPFYVCPGTSSWLSIAGRSDNAIGNLRHAADAGVRHGARGFLNTDWGDHGHWQPLPVSYLPFAYGAAVAWNAEHGIDLSDLLAFVDRFIFEDAAGVMARLAYDLGNAYRVANVTTNNASPLHGLLRRETPPDGITAEAMHAADTYVEQVIARIDGARMDRNDADLIADEFRHIARLLRYATRVGLAHLEGAAIPAGDPALVAEHERVWLERNRPGGLPDSSRRLRQGLRLESFGARVGW